MEKQLNPETVFLCTLTHNGQLDARMAGVFYTQASKERLMNIEAMPTSLLASGCNKLWCKALNTREKYNLKWFCMLHADVVPEPWFIDKLIAIAEHHDADVLSAIIPIKGPEGVTSTALSGPDEFTRLTRLTMQQINDPSFPETFDVEMACEKLGYPASIDRKLLVNTGCMIARIDKQWSAMADFTINDQITYGIDGLFHEQVEPEDWYFSRRVAELGGKVMATRAVVVEHVGTMSYASNKAWGYKRDPHSLAV